MSAHPAHPFHIGMAVWGYRGWLGSFFPLGTPPSDFLARYVERVSAVEGNTTFYALPSVETVAKWEEAMPEGFLFCPKLDRRVTHEGRLCDGTHLAKVFTKRMEGLKENLGPTLVQLPPSYAPHMFEDLAEFVASWPHASHRMALEVRHLGWWEDGPARRLHELCASYGIARVVLDTRPIYEETFDWQATSERKKPHVPCQPIVTTDFTLVRYVGHPDPQKNERYLTEWADQLTDWMRDDEPPLHVFFFAHCPVEERSPGYARTLQAMLEERGAPVPPLPWNAIKDPPTQLGLF